MNSSIESRRKWGGPVLIAGALAAALFIGLGLVLGCGSRAEPGRAEQPPETEPTGPEIFQDVTAGSGINFAYRNGEEVQPPNLAILESLGGGAAAIDYDKDGLLDLFFPGGGYYGGADKKQILGHPCRLYRNLGGWKFKDVTNEVGLDRLAEGKPWFYSHGVAVADYDRDGWPDILVTGWGRIALFHNEADGKGGRRFSDVTAAAGLDRGVTWATSAAFADLDGDGWPDLYVCQYVDWSFANHPDCNYDGKTPDVCPPKKFKGLPAKLYRNTGVGTFVDVSATAGLKLGPESKSLGVVVADVNEDGKPDIYVANDTVANFFYVNKSTKGTIRLNEQGMVSGVALDGGGSPNGSMGVDVSDPEGTGKPAIWVTNYENEFHALYRNVSAADRVHFVFATPSSGIGAIGQKFVGWGTGFADFDRDGWEDIFIANGHAIRFPTGTTRHQRPVLMQNRGSGKFIDISKRGGSYFQKQHLSRGVLLADLDNDGQLDVVVVQTNDPVALLRNVSADANHWVGIELAGRDRADVVGTRVMLEAAGRTQTRFAKGGGSYASSPDRRFVFGLGKEAKGAKLSVVWPDGSRQEWADLLVDRYHVVTQGQERLSAPPK
jgi:enediyne biosynthesis protein E4